MSRAFTAAENAAADADAAAVRDRTNGMALRVKAQNAIAANDAYLAIVSPTNAQVVAQLNKVTRQDTALIRLVLGLLDSTDGT